MSALKKSPNVVQTMRKEQIAIVGIGCRFPGGVDNPEALWKLLVEGREAVGDVPADRWNVERFYDSESGIVGKSIAKRGGFVEGIDQFDPQFFGISPREAPYVDPQHRLLLETAWEAMEDAGLVLDLEKGTDLAVFVGISHNDYQIIQGTPWDSSGITPHSPTGTAHSIAANRISYCFNLLGPSVAMDTACSSALTAVHSACEHIWAGRGDMALAGGVTVMITPGGFIGFSQASMLSPEGRCAAFDASASGFVRGEGAGMVLLKSMSRAIADGDTIHGVIVGTAINQDGHTNGISLPSADAQARLVKDACKDAGVHPNQIGFVEAHGTGTAVGDPIEAHALATALCENRSPDAPLPIGSCKTNLGHLETAAGVAGLLKAMLTLKHRIIPPSLHFKTPNPNIDFEALKMRVVTQTEPFPEANGPRMAGVNSFGFGGANAHVILAEPPTAPHRTHHEVDATAERPWPLVLSARSEAALKVYAERLAAWLEAKEKANGSSPTLPDLTYTLGTRRNHHPFRLSIVSASMREAIEELTSFATGKETAKVRTAFAPRREKAPRVGFVMSGQGPQWWGMGRELMQHEPVFRKVMEQCDAAMKPWARFGLLEELGRTEETSQLHRTEIAQPAIFAMQMALAELWKSWGVQPAAITGHSVGEIAAACAAGIFTLEEAAKIIVGRARFMEECARGAGTMLAVGLDETEARALIARHDPAGSSISAFNGPKSITISGPRAVLEAMAAELEAKEVFARLVRVDHPFHHALMQPAADALEKSLAGLQPRHEAVPFFSTVTGNQLAGEECGPTHWARGIRQPVLFAPAVNALADFGVDVWLEISAHPALARSIQECLAGRGGKVPILSSTRREREHEALLETAMDLHLACLPLDFAAMTPSRRLLSLPAYAWDKARWWSESGDWREGRLASGGRGLLDLRVPRAVPVWTARLDARHMAFLKDHKVENHVIFPAAAFVEMILEAGVQLFEGRPFVVEDFEIRKPLILPEPASGVQMEVSYDPNERTFSIQSRFEQSSAWSLHVVGSMRGERTDSLFASSGWNEARPTNLPAVNREDFYQHMTDMGLRYGPEFQPVQELAAAGGKSAGKVVLSEATAARAGEYAVHPVLFDGALHVFSAGSATVEDRRSRMKLPVRFAKILFLRPLGATAHVHAEVHQFNDQFLEGGLRIYDGAGQPCVLVEGFRAIAVSGTRRGSSGGQRDLVYHVDWQRTPVGSSQTAQAPLPLAKLITAAQQALENVVGDRGRGALEAAMRGCDDVAATLFAAGLRKAGASDSGFNADTLKVAASLRPQFERLMEKLMKRAWLEKSGSLYKPTKAFIEHAEAEQENLREFLGKFPGHLPEALLCQGNCAELGAILRGEKEAVQVLFAGAGPELLEQFYSDGLLTSHWLGAISTAVKAAAAHLPEGRGLRILEVGAGTGGLAAQLLPQLERGLHSYLFSDVSAGFFSAAGQKLAAFPEVEYKVFDIERPGTDQGLEAGSFDFVIGTNVLHAVSDVSVTLKHIHDLLAPGGSLVFMDVATPSFWTETVFGLTSGWWKFTDHHLRQGHPLLGRAQWEAVMKGAGFAETASLPGLHSPEGEGQIGLFARKTWQQPEPQKTPAPKTEETVGATSWLLFADASGVAGRLAARLREQGLRCRIVSRGQQFAAQEPDTFTVRAEAPEDWTQLLESIADDAPPERYVYLWTLDESTKGEDAVLMDTDALLHLTKALEATAPAAKLQINVVTRGAQAAGRDRQPTAVAQAPAIGLLRVINNEHPNFGCRGIDLPMKTTAQDEEHLWAELWDTGPEREIALRDEARYVQRLDRGRAQEEQWLAPGTPMRLVSRERGHLDTLRFDPFAEPVCAPGEVLIDVKAAGMNFRDVLKALALYPGDAPDAKVFGDEIGGIVKAVGAGVTHVAPGDRVFGLAVFGLATHTLARGGDVRRIPDGLTFEEAATMPVVFMTAWHSLYNVARMRAGESILVHAGAGGVGMAAIQIALHLGCEVIATAGSPTKRALLETLGVKHVIDSRRADFADAVMELTGRRGVDVVLNALAAEAIPMGLSCLAEFGRFIEIGKRDIYQNSRIPLWPLRHNASFHVVAMDAVFGRDEALTRKLLAEMTDRVETGAFTPLPFRAFPASRIEAAFRLMASGKHIGKVVVAFPESFVPRHGEPLRAGFAIRPDGCYWITGAFGGFGKVLADWLVQGGARHLVLSSRSGASTPEAAEFVKGLQGRGVEVTVTRADAASREDIERTAKMIRESGQPLRGVFHLAMVIDDAPLSALTRERMRTVMAPKAHGAWLLHEATRDLALDCFVMFSSVSSIFGNPAQGNYSAANAFLDSLAHHRHALGLPALTVNWGVLGGEGYVARNERVAEFLAKQGTEAISPGEVTTLLESFLKAGSAQAVAIRVDWSKWRQFFRGMQEKPLLERIFAGGMESQEAGGKSSDWRLKIEAAAPEERTGVIGQALREVIGGVLRVKPDSLRDDQPLTDLGLDSLMGVEIETSIESAIGVSLPPASLMRARTIGQIVNLLAEHLGEKSKPAAPARPAAEVAPAPAEAVDVEALSDQDLDRLLADDTLTEGSEVAGPRP